jgi:2-methylcitrate dehydratase PrpD
VGLALAQAAGTQQANLEQVLSKRLQPALAARHGVFSAYLAAAGATAPAQALEGRFGLRALTQPGDDELALLGLWRDWQFRETTIKRYPVCACSHAAIEALLLLRQKTVLVEDRIQTVVAHVSPFMARLVGGAFSLENDLQVTAQFSLRYHLASIILRGRLGLSETDPQALLDPKIVALIPKIEVVVDELNHEELAPARVAVLLASGEWLEATCDHVPGDAAHPLSQIEWQTKLLECAERSERPITSAQLAELQMRVDHLDDLNDVSQFWRGLNV